MEKASSDYSQLRRKLFRSIAKTVYRDAICLSEHLQSDFAKRQTAISQDLQRRDRRLSVRHSTPRTRKVDLTWLKISIMKVRPVDLESFFIFHYRLLVHLSWQEQFLFCCYTWSSDSACPIRRDSKLLLLFLRKIIRPSNPSAPLRSNSPILAKEQWKNYCKKTPASG